MKYFEGKMFCKLQLEIMKKEKNIYFLKLKLKKFSYLYIGTEVSIHVPEFNKLLVNLLVTLFIYDASKYIEIFFRQLSRKI